MKRTREQRSSHVVVRPGLLASRSNVLSQSSKFPSSLARCRLSRERGRVKSSGNLSVFDFGKFSPALGRSSGNDYTGRDYCKHCLQLSRHLQWFEGSSELIKGWNCLKSAMLFLQRQFQTGFPNICTFCSAALSFHDRRLTNGWSNF